MPVDRLPETADEWMRWVERRLRELERHNHPSLTARVDDLDARVTDLESRVTSVESRVTSLETRDAVRTSDANVLPTFTPGIQGSFVNWGSELVFTNPVEDVRVKAWTTGESREPGTGEAVTNTRLRVSISIDGGSTFSFGEAPLEGVGATPTQDQRAVLKDLLHVSGTPTGDIIVRAAVSSSASTVTEFRRGYLMADIEPL